MVSIAFEDNKLGWKSRALVAEMKLDEALRDLSNAKAERDQLFIEIRQLEDRWRVAVKPGCLCNACIEAPSPRDLNP